MRISVASALLAAAIAGTALPTGCSTAPKADNQASFISESKAAEQWFRSHVNGLDRQIASSAGYIVYPGVGQWGILFMGGQFGRGTVNDPSGNQIGWGAINIASIGLQAGVRGFKMLVVIQDQKTMDNFKANRLQGSTTGVLVAGDAGGGGTAPFVNGVVAYQGASSGLMAGVNVGLDYLRYKALGDDK